MVPTYTGEIHRGRSCTEEPSDEGTLPVSILPCYCHGKYTIKMQKVHKSAFLSVQLFRSLDILHQLNPALNQ